MNAAHSPWLAKWPCAMKYTAKNVAAAAAIETSIPRVMVQPMNIPSHTNDAIPASGMASAQ